MTKYQKYKLIILAVFSFFLLLILWNYSSKGRYTMSDDRLVILDTKTGTSYIPSRKTYLEIGDYKKRN